MAVQSVYDHLQDICMEIKKSNEKVSVTELLIRLMDSEGMLIHCPYHHFVVLAAVMTVVAMEKNEQDEVLEGWLNKAKSRAKTIPGGMCGEYGSCGAAIGIGIAVSVMTGATPKSTENWKWANEATGRALMKVAEYGGPRCCKRVSFLSVSEGVKYINEIFGLNLDSGESVSCKYYKENTECIGGKCPFFKKKA